MCVPARLCVLRRTQRRTLLTWRACLTPPSPTLSPRSQARTLTTKAQERIARNLNAFEEETGYRILVLRCALVRTVRGVFETRETLGTSDCQSLKLLKHQKTEDRLPAQPRK